MTISKAGDGRLGEKWAKVRERNAQIIESGKCVIYYGQAGKVMRLYVACPYKPEFAEGARKYVGRFRPRTHVWSFRPYQFGLVLDLCIKHFGEENVQKP